MKAPAREKQQEKGHIESAIWQPLDIIIELNENSHKEALQEIPFAKIRQIAWQILSIKLICPGTH